MTGRVLAIDAYIKKEQENLCQERSGFTLCYLQVANRIRERGPHEVL